VEWVVREGWGQGGEMTQALYAHMNNKTIKKNKAKKKRYQYADHINLTKFNIFPF
jgi:hypothetical protein